MRCRSVRQYAWFSFTFDTSHEERLKTISVHAHDSYHWIFRLVPREGLICDRVVWTSRGRHVHHDALCQANYVFAFNITVPIHTLFRSCNVIGSVALGWLLFDQRYSLPQLSCVLVITVGISLCSIGDAQSHNCSNCDWLPRFDGSKNSDVATWACGIGLLCVCQLLQAALGHTQAIFYRRYQACAQTHRDKLFVPSGHISVDTPTTHHRLSLSFFCKTPTLKWWRVPWIWPPIQRHCAKKQFLLTLYMLRSLVDFLLTTSRLLADSLFVCHLLTSQCSSVIVTPCDISCAQPFHDESSKDLLFDTLQHGSGALIIHCIELSC